MKKCIVLVLIMLVSLIASPKPMEPLDHYNVVLIHGAADSTQGFIGDCSEDFSDAWTLLQKKIAATEEESK